MFTILCQPNYVCTTLVPYRSSSMHPNAGLRLKLTWNGAFDQWWPWIRRVLRIKWLNHTTNTVVREHTGQPAVNESIHQWRLATLGHVCQ